MSDCRFGVSPVNYPDPDPDQIAKAGVSQQNQVFLISVHLACHNRGWVVHVLPHMFYGFTILFC